MLHTTKVYTRHPQVTNVIELSFYTIVAQASLPVNDRLEACATIKI